MIFTEKCQDSGAFGYCGELAPPLKVGRCPCIGVFWTFVGGLESADDELSGREKARGDSYSEWGLVEM